MNDREEKAHVLVIEDERVIQSVLRMQLEALGYRVTTASDGHEGFKLAQEVQPDVILLDLMMPEMDGFQVLKRVKSIARLSKTPVIILTASADERHRRKGMSHCADAYLNKPYKLDQLASTIERLLQALRQPQSPHP